MKPLNDLQIIYGKKSFKTKNTIFVKEEDFHLFFGVTSEIPLDKLKKIETTKFQGSTIPDLFSYDDFSFWWFIQPSVYPAFKKYVNFVENFISFIDEKKPSTIKIENDFSKFELLQQICSIKQINFEYPSIKYLQYKILNKIKTIIQKYRYKKIFNNKIRKRINVFKSKEFKIPSLNQKIIFAISTLYRRTIFNHRTGRSERLEHIQQVIMDLINDNEKIVGIDLDYTFKGNAEILKERLDSYLKWIPLEALLTKSSNSLSHKKFLKNYEKIISDKKFHELFEFKGIQLWSQLSMVFQSMLYAPYLPFYLNLVDCIQEKLEKNKPQAIFLPYETGPIAQAFIIVSTRLHIKSIGISHSTIYEHNPMYSFKRLRKSDEPNGFPLPDYLLVYGKFSKDSLLKEGYPSEKIIVFGNPAYFYLEEITKKLEEQNTLLKYKIKKGQKVILLATEYMTEFYSHQGKYNYNSLMWEYLLKEFGNDDNYKIILKPHPNENTTVYEKILMKYPSSNAEIIQGDLYELLYISSIVVSVFSNIMNDALCFEKPVVRVTFEEVEHPVPYEKYGVVLSTNLENMSKNIIKTLNDKQIIDNLKKNLREFLKEQNNLPVDDPEKIIKKILN